MSEAVLSAWSCGPAPVHTHDGSYYDTLKAREIHFGGLFKK